MVIVALLGIRATTDGAPLKVALYLTMIGDKFPLLVVADLLERDAINLVVRESTLSAKKLSASQPLAERLKGLKGVRLGV
jgi:hypothetical protein